MTQKYRCDSCGEPKPENVLIRIKAVGAIWFRCPECRESYRQGEILGDKPRSSGHYAQIRTGAIFGGWEYEDRIIRFNP